MIKMSIDGQIVKVEDTRRNLRWQGKVSDAARMLLLENCYLTLGQWAEKLGLDYHKCYKRVDRIKGAMWDEERHRYLVPRNAKFPEDLRNGRKKMKKYG